MRFTAAETLEERMDRLHIPEPMSGCWLWIGGLNQGGYGKINLRSPGKSYYRSAHRVVYELKRGPIPAGLTLDHLCRNRACVNPAHLEPVSSRDNTLRGIGFAAINARKTHCIHGHSLTGHNVMASIRITSGLARRRCRICHFSQLRNRDRRGKH